MSVASSDIDSVVSGEEKSDRTSQNSSNGEGSKTITKSDSKVACDNCVPMKKKKIFHPKPDPTPGRCHFYVERKNRYCKAPHAKDKVFCTEHSHEMKDPSVRKRIPCPLDPKHSCYEDGLQKHLKKCNARPDLRPSCYEENINAGSDESEDPKTYKVSVKGVTIEEIRQMVEKVRKMYKDHISSLKQEVLFHQVLKEEAENPQMGQAAQKHIQQQASLVGNMERLGLLGSHHCYVEFGAGKGGLSHWVQLSVKDLDDTQFVLVDKSSCRYKMDNYHKGTDQGPSFERVKMDIQHLNLGKLPALTNSTKHLVGIGKHLCGGATDLMLRCLMETLHRDQDGASSQLSHRYVSGVMLAVCCHHRCDWKTYVGKNFLKQCGLTARDFHLMCSMTSWATCNSPHVKEGGVVESADKPDEVKDPATYNHPKYGNLLPQEREKLGYWCKNLIDYGRVEYMRKHGFDCDIIAYVDKNYTIENTAIMAKRKS